MGMARFVRAILLIFREWKMTGKPGMSRDSYRYQSVGIYIYIYRCEYESMWRCWCEWVTTRRGRCDLWRLIMKAALAAATTLMLVLVLVLLYSCTASHRVWRNDMAKLLLTAGAAACLCPCFSRVLHVNYRFRGDCCHMLLPTTPLPCLYL